MSKTSPRPNIPLLQSRDNAAGPLPSTTDTRGRRQSQKGNYGAMGMPWDSFVQQALHVETRQDGPLGRDATG